MGDFGVLVLAVFAAGILRGVTGFGFAMAAVPLMSLVVSPFQAVLCAQVLQCLIVPMDLYQNHKHIDRPAVSRLLIGTCVGTPIGVWLLVTLPDDIMRMLIALVVLAGLVALWMKIRFSGQAWQAYIAGTLAGICAGMAAMPGPPAVAYFLGRDTSSTIVRASLMVFFGGTALIALALMAITQGLEMSQLLWATLAFPAMILGDRVGTRLFETMDAKLYRTAAMGLFVLTAVLAGSRGIAAFLPL